MRPALSLLTYLAAASCATSADTPAPALAPSMPAPAPADPGLHAEPAAELRASADAPASVAELECLGELPERMRVRFEPGHTARDVAVWYATTACRQVESSRALLGRSTLVEVDAIVGRGELLDFLHSLLGDLGLAAQEHGDAVAIVAPAGQDADGAERIVLAPIEEDEVAAP